MVYHKRTAKQRTGAISETRQHPRKHFISFSRFIGGVAIIASSHNFGVSAQSVGDESQQQQQAVVQKKTLTTMLKEGSSSTVDLAQRLFVDVFPEMLFFLAVFASACLLAYVIPDLLNEILNRFDVSESRQDFTKIISRVAIVTGGAFAAARAIGVDFLPIAVSFNVLSFLVSTALSDTVDNIFCGLILRWQGLVRPGVEITVTGTHGIVDSMTLFNVFIISMDQNNRLVMKPNVEVAKTSVEFHNYTVAVQPEPSVMQSQQLDTTQQPQQRSTHATSLTNEQRQRIQTELAARRVDGIENKKDT